MAAFFRQDNRELLAAIAAAYIRVAEEEAEQISNRLLHHVSGVMTENFVESLEMVKVEEKNGQRLLFAGAATCSSLSSDSSRKRRSNSCVSGSRIDFSRRAARMSNLEGEQALE